MSFLCVVTMRAKLNHEKHKTFFVVATEKRKSNGNLGLHIMPFSVQLNLVNFHDGATVKLPL